MQKKIKLMQKILMSLFVLGAVVAGHAQTIIPKAGLTISSTNASVTDAGLDTKLSSAAGFTVGVGYNYPLGTVGKGLFSVQPELAFIQKGFKAKSTGEFYMGEAIFEMEADQHYKINYLEVPLLSKIEFGSPSARFFFLAGPSIGYGLGGKLSGTMTLDDGYEVFEGDIDADIKFGEEPDDEEIEDVYFNNRVDFGLQLGAGVTLANRIAVEVRYGLGLSNLSDESDSANRVVQFTVGVPLKLK
jgi:hypothetical protein